MSFGIKKCEICDKEIVCKVKRDLIRKRFCSKKCLGIWMVKNGLLKNDYSEETRKKMRDSKLNLIKTGWRPIGWKKYNLPLNIIRGYYFKGSNPEHRIIAEKMFGRKLYKNEIVHHKDLNKLNNSLDNLIVMTRSEHIKLHLELRKQCPKVSTLA